MMGGKSVELEDRPPVPGCVRSTIIISGMYMVELEPKLIELTFLLESDLKLSLFIQKQAAPKATNYAYFIKKFMEGQK